MIHSSLIGIPWILIVADDGERCEYNALSTWLKLYSASSTAESSYMDMVFI